jgi:hypothetical protein
LSRNKTYQESMLDTRFGKSITHAADALASEALARIAALSAALQCASNASPTSIRMADVHQIAGAIRDIAQVAHDQIDHLTARPGSVPSADSTLDDVGDMTVG